ncbi:MAG: HAD family hydrolase [Eubacteriales bacterium]|nr:HAD family hydrolase [Eubacteriales bacterium]
MPIRHIIWDFNGTLLDDGRVTMDVVNAMLHRRSLPPMDYPFYRAVVMFPVMEYYRRLGFDLQGEGFDGMVEEFVAGYEAVWRQAQVLPDVYRALEELQGLGLQTSVLTASHLDAAREQLDYFDLSKYFDVVTGTDSFAGHGKTQLAAEHMRRCGLTGGETVLIGDSPHDLETAQEAGCGCILLSCGHFSRIRLQQYGVPVADTALEAIGLRDDPAAFAGALRR